MKSGRALALLALVVVAAVGGYVVQRQLQPKSTLTAVPATVADAPPAGPSDGQPEPDAPPLQKPVPETLPGFSLPDRDGRPRTLADWSGRPLIVNYWATWCPPCIREIPLLTRLRQDYKTQSLEVIGIAVDVRDDVLAFAAKRKLEYPLLIGEDEGLAAVTAVGMEPTFPFTIFADSKQRIVTLKVGELHEDEAKLILAEVVRLDAGQTDLAAARAVIDQGLKDLATQRALSEEKSGKAAAATG